MLSVTPGVRLTPGITFVGVGLGVAVGLAFGSAGVDVGLGVTVGLSPGPGGLSPGSSSLSADIDGVVDGVTVIDGVVVVVGVTDGDTTVSILQVSDNSLIDASSASVGTNPGISMVEPGCSIIRYVLPQDNSLKSLFSGNPNQ